MEYQNKKKILIFIDWFLPGYKGGGPIRTIANLINNLKDEFDFSVVTSDRDHTDKEAYKNVQLNQWNELESGCKVFYISKSSLGIVFIKNIIIKENFDFIFLNSIFSFYYSLLPLYLVRMLKPEVKIILAPRGMLGSSALRIKSLKKRTFLYIMNKINFFNSVIWQASSNDEAQEIKQNIKKISDIRIATNFPDLLANNYIHRKKDKFETKFCFYSRLSPKKNLLFALELFMELRPKEKLIFDIIGPIDDQLYWKKCQAIISNLDRNVQVNYLGPIDHHLLKDTISNYHFLILPTLHENFGHVVLEALSCSLPVIISNTTYWKALEKFNAGFDLGLENKDKWLEILNKCLKMEQSEYDNFSHSAFSYAIKFSNDPRLLAENKNIFTQE